MYTDFDQDFMIIGIWHDKAFHSFLTNFKVFTELKKILITLFHKFNFSLTVDLQLALSSFKNHFDS